MKRFEQQRDNLLKTARKEEEVLQKQLNEIQGLISALNGTVATPAEGNGRRKPRNVRKKPTQNGRRKGHKMSAAGRKAIAEAQRLRWAKQKKEKAKAEKS